MGTPGRIIDVEHLSSQIVSLVQKCASTGVLLLDVKPGNMVAKEMETDAKGKFDIRMIDFDDTFTAPLNRHYIATGAYTDQDCVFTLNALLLLFHAMNLFAIQGVKRVFKPLAVAMEQKWSVVARDKERNAFCAYLDKDKVFSEGISRLNPEKHLGNLTDVSSDKFYELMRSSYYVILQAYAGDFVYDREKVPEGVDSGYLAYLVSEVRAQFQ